MGVLLALADLLISLAIAFAVLHALVGLFTKKKFKPIELLKFFGLYLLLALILYFVANFFFLGGIEKIAIKLAVYLAVMYGFFVFSLKKYFGANFLTSITIYTLFVISMVLVNFVMTWLILQLGFEYDLASYGFFLGMVKGWFFAYPWAFIQEIALLMN